MFYFIYFSIWCDIKIICFIIKPNEFSIWIVLNDAYTSKVIAFNVRKFIIIIRYQSLLAVITLLYPKASFVRKSNSSAIKRKIEISLLITVSMRTELSIVSFVWNEFKDIIRKEEFWGISKSFYYTDNIEKMWSKSAIFFWLFLPIPFLCCFAGFSSYWLSTTLHMKLLRNLFASGLTRRLLYNCLLLVVALYSSNMFLWGVGAIVAYYWQSANVQRK